MKEGEDEVGSSISFADRTGVEHGIFEMPKKSKVADGQISKGVHQRRQNDYS